MSFNAIVWDVEAHTSRRVEPSFGMFQSKSNIFAVGRVFLPNLTDVPAAWRIQYRSGVASRDSKLEEMLWSDNQPLHIFKPRARAILENESQITLKYASGNTLPVTICATTTVAELKERIHAGGQDSFMFLELELGGKAFRNDELVLGRVSFGGVVNIVYRYPRTSKLQVETVDLQGDQLAGRLRANDTPGTRPGQIKSWKTFHLDNMGLTMYGHCPVATCDSNVHKSCADRVVVQAKYGVVRLTPGMDKFACPLCHTAGKSVDARGMFTPENFNVMFGRSLFRFKKCGNNEPVKTVLMESLSATGEYATFESGSEPSHYEVIEILTVGPNSSPYYCVKCDIRCHNPVANPDCQSISEVILSCGHAYHSGCLSEDKSCFVCASELIENVSALVTDDDTSSTSQAIDFEANKCELFSDFYPDLGETNSIVNTAYLKIAFYEFQLICAEILMSQRQEQMAIDEESD